MAQACGKAPKETPMSDSGSSVKPMDTEYTPGSTATVTKASSRTVSSTARACSDLQMETSTRACMLWANPLASASTTGQTAATSKAPSKPASAAARGSGRKARATPTSTRAST